MDLCADMLLQTLAHEHQDFVTAEVVRPSYKRLFSVMPAPAKAKKAANNADRIYNRFREYPRALARTVKRRPFDVYHIIDHSYAQLAHALPSDRVVVTCYDLDAFKSLLEPDREPRPFWFRALASKILSGLKRARVVACSSQATRDAILRHELVEDDRLRVVYCGVNVEFAPESDPRVDEQAIKLLSERIRGFEPSKPPPLLLHVGSTIPRKRIDVLLRVLAGIVKARPDAVLLRVGGPLTGVQQELARELGVAEKVIELPFLDRRVLASVYRHAALVLQPSEAEGFGLPIAEAQACGKTVLASNLDVLREVGGNAAEYATVADVPQWVQKALSLLAEPAGGDAVRLRSEASLANAKRFSWSQNARGFVEIYREIAGV